jgi:DTW domain-containing protein YfiP
MNIDLQQYLSRRSSRSAELPIARVYCSQCKKPTITCYCHHLRPFVSDPEFIILMHPNESKRSIASGRMASLCLRNAVILEGIDFSEDEKLNAILEDPMRRSLLLFPGTWAINLSLQTPAERESMFPRDERLAVIVLDGTWDEAKSIKHRSRNLATLQMISFTPPIPSRFKQVRKQPASYCFSTIESIEHIIKLFDRCDDSLSDNLIEVFETMVQQQIKFADHRTGRPSRGPRGNSCHTP